MQSKLLINILASVALIGLTAFVTVTLTTVDKQNVSNRNTQEIENLFVKNLRLGQENEVLEKKLIDLKEKKAFLEGGISENEKSSGELDAIILLLGEKRRLLLSDVEILENKKGVLESIAATPILKSNDLRDLVSKKVNSEVKKLNNLLVQVKELGVENTELKKQVARIKSSFDTKVIDNLQTLQLVNSKLKKTENTALEKQDVLKKEINELLGRIGVLIAENKRDSDLATNEKERLIEEFKLEKKALRITSQNQIEIENLKNLKSNFEKLNGLRVIFSGNMIYDESSSQIVFQADNSIGIPIFQDDFTGSIAGQCGLPIDKEIENRCAATIIAEFVVESTGLFLRGQEIVEIVQK
jgi:cell division septum initiation protein DivIVA